MDMMLWAARASHLFAVAVWIGGSLYQAGVVLPLWTADDPRSTEMTIATLRRYLPFQWMGLSTVFVTGICLMMFSPRFVFFSYSDWWSIALGLKQIAFLLMVFFSFGFSRMVKLYFDQAASRDSIRLRILQFNRSGVFLGIVAILLAASMQ
jgi:uncharacterized membrane protein